MVRIARIAKISGLDVPIATQHEKIPSEGVSSNVEERISNVAKLVVRIAPRFISGGDQDAVSVTDNG